MRGRITFGLMSIVAAIAAAAPVRADDKSDIHAGYKKLVDAVKGRDLAGVMAVGTPDFSMKMGSMVMSTAQVKAQMKMNFDMMKTAPKFTATVDKISIKKNTAEVQSTGNMSADIVDTAGVFGTKGAKHKLTDLQVSKDTWVKTETGWKMKMTETLTDKMTLDGKPYNSAGAPSGGVPARK